MIQKTTNSTKECIVNSLPFPSSKKSTTTSFLCIVLNISLKYTNIWVSFSTEMVVNTIIQPFFILSFVSKILQPYAAFTNKQTKLQVPLLLQRVRSSNQDPWAMVHMPLTLAYYKASIATSTAFTTSTFESLIINKFLNYFPDCSFFVYTLMYIQFFFF